VNVYRGQNTVKYLASMAAFAKPKLGLGPRLRNATKEQPVFGTCVLCPSLEWHRALSNQPDLDFLFVDTEHIALDRSQVRDMCQLYNKGLGLPCLVRIPGHDPNAATSMIDAGACGVVTPYTETVDQVQALRGAVKCRPLKGERLERYLAGEAIEPELEAYMKKFCKGNALVVNIESVPAMRNLDDILKVPDLDAVLIGPHDLSCSLGVAEQWDHPKFKAACKEILTKAHAAGVGAAIHCGGEATAKLEFEQFLLNECDCTVLVHASDVQLFSVALRNDLATIKQAVGIAPAAAAAGGGDTTI